ncbi:MAG: hypothetical protein K6T91_02955 [Firmicutes bacterium]|nr:hypothetical protein [Bacillota bacterium]
MLRTRLVEPRDAEAIRGIYNVEVLESTVTFDLVPRSPAEQLAWVEAHSGGHPAIVAVDAADRVLGFILLQASSSLQTPLSFAAIAILTIIGVVLYYLLELLEHLLIPWHVSKRQPGAGPTL